MLPLQSAGLRQARMIKNSQLEGVIELFRGKNTGSGQILPSDLPKIFQMGDAQQHDLHILDTVSRLSSFDVYSLRIELRRLAIDVEDQSDLKLSHEAQALAAPYMKDFTRPLIAFLRQGSSERYTDDTEILSVLTEVAKANTRDNFVRLAERLEIELGAIPTFLEDYRDVYLSLAYYASCSAHLKQQSKNALRSFDVLKNIPTLAADTHLINSMDKVERCLTIISADVNQIVEDFKQRTHLMWEDISATRFRAMRDLVMHYQIRLGAALCAASAKIHAWEERFPQNEPASPIARATFIRNDMTPGLDLLRRIPKLGTES